jgi:aspartyl-tRNA(Asn)/glutamyl-tRNA(Gln) amidotransferase subunit C
MRVLTMTLGIEEVKAIAHLARIDIDETELSGYVKNLANVLALAEKMDEINTEGVEAMAHPSHASQPLRADVVTESDQHEKFQQLAPAVADGLYLVPKVIE